MTAYSFLRHSGSGLSGSPPSEPFSFLKRATRFSISSRDQVRVVLQSLIGLLSYGGGTPMRRALMLATLLFAGCATQAPPKPVNLIVFPGGFNWPIWVAQEKGLFAKHGIEPKITPTPGSAFQLTGLIEGRFDIAMTAIDNLIAYREGQGEAKIVGPDLIAFMGGDNGFLRLVAVPEVRSFADLKGKTVSVDALTTGYAFVLLELLERGGLQRERDYKVERAGGVMQRFNALRKKRHAARLLLSPSEMKAEARVFTRLADASSML